MFLQKFVRRYSIVSSLAWCALCVAMYQYAPPRYDFAFNAGCGIIYMLMSINFFMIKQKKNFFDFDTIFILVFFGVMLYFPIFLYPTDPERFVIFKYKYNLSLISKGSALADIGMSFYMLGSIIRERSRKKAKATRAIPLPHIFISIVGLSCFALYVALGGWHNLYSQYLGGESVDSGISNYLNVLSITILSVLVIVWFNNQYIRNKHTFRIQKIPRLELFYFIGVIILLLTAGSRTFPMTLLLMFIGLYSLLYRHISFQTMGILFCAGLIAMFAIMLYRSGTSTNGDFNFADVISDLIVNTRNTYVAMDYADKHGYSYGVSLLMYLMAPIPLLQQYVIKYFGLLPTMTASSHIITAATLGKVGTWGLGTNIIADLYIAFGAIGVAVMMAMLGYFICSVQKNAKTNIYALTTYGIMLGHSVFLTRAEYFYPLRMLLWSLLIIYFLRMWQITYKTKR